MKLQINSKIHVYFNYNSEKLLVNHSCNKAWCPYWLVKAAAQKITTVAL